MSIYTILRIYDPEAAIRMEFNRSRYLLDCVRGKSVLHVGCSDYPITEDRLENDQLLHTMLCSSASTVYGIDLSEEGVTILRRHGFSDVEVMDAEDLHINAKYDVVVAGDVMEHMNNPGKFLEGVLRVLAPGGELIIGVPSALSVNVLKAWFLHREQVHCDHTFYFSPKTLAVLCSRYDLFPTRLVFTVQPRTSHEKWPFITFRRLLLSMCKTMAPSLIMHFKRGESVDWSQYTVWR